jgi:hypothetical protein
MMDEFPVWTPLDDLESTLWSLLWVVLDGSKGKLRLEDKYLEALEASDIRTLNGAKTTLTTVLRSNDGAVSAVDGFGRTLLACFSLFDDDFVPIAGIWPHIREVQEDRCRQIIKHLYALNQSLRRADVPDVDLACR